MEARMRLGLYNAPLGDIKPLNETRYVSLLVFSFIPAASSTLDF
jgi:hypothetical protein